MPPAERSALYVYTYQVHHLEVIPIHALGSLALQTMIARQNKSIAITTKLDLAECTETGLDPFRAPKSLPILSSSKIVPEKGFQL